MPAAGYFYKFAFYRKPFGIIMGRFFTEPDPNRKKEYWEDDFNILVKKIGVTPIQKLPKGNLRIGKQVGSILSVMLDGKADYEDVFRETGMGRPRFRIALQRAKRNGMVTVDGKLTQLGRWCAIAFRVNASFIEFCILADLYFYRSLCWDNDVRGYIKGDVLVSVLKMNYLQMARAYHRLVIKGHARCRFGIVERFDPNVLHIDDGVFLMLHEYMEDLIIMKRALQ